MSMDYSGLPPLKYERITDTKSLRSVDVYGHFSIGKERNFVKRKIGDGLFHGFTHVYLIRKYEPVALIEMVDGQVITPTLSMIRFKKT